MIRFFFIFIFIFALPSHFLFAGCEDGKDDLTKPDFSLCLENMDPINDGYENTATWTDALLFILGKIADILLFVVPILAGISLMVAWYYYIFSSGDTDKATQAKTIIKWNVVALLVAFFSYAMVSMVLYIMNLL